jgi:pimeloyl-ACP methyl ester carboxylesterase
VTSRRTAIVATGLAAGALASGLAGRALLRLGRRGTAVDGDVELPPEDLGTVMSADGTAIAVRAAGPADAPILLFVHGFSLDMTTWQGQWAGLGDRYRCILLDLRGLGRSAPPESGELTVAAMADDVAAVLEAHVPADRPAVVVAHSVGAMIVFALAASRPDSFRSRVAGVVVIGGAAGDLLRGAMGSIADALRLRIGSLPNAARRLNAARRALFARPGDAAALAVRLTQFGPEASPELVDRIVSLAARAPSAVWTDGLAGVLEADVTPSLARVDVPVLVVVGDADRVTPPASAVAIVGALPDARLEVVPGAGHIAMLERPAEVNANIAAFAEDVFARSRRRRAPRRRRTA